ncbi:hydantoinase/carbamoylase family amidase [Falsigemmobacter faecalis]|uniref:Zn-dependent hydrolase n=1 Tax=Falsigemmobacter faecalis TaxID=2488730 RepID=A0A3P3D969_9RHOB|nr:hydantoinase/carbamoylase family amidase [Falsigemmobacter faecalis]RRH70146.1 Zn-dependent hydrolase [Falsigemmobacter faecalis]
MTDTFTVDTKRMLSDLDALRGIGQVSTGVVRQAFSEADIEARSWLVRRMEEAGLEVSVDALGNVFGLPPGNAPALLVGSHSDTQPEGGWLDGAYGVIAGLELARASLEQGGPAIACVSFQDEEGRFGNLIGSRYCAGSLSLEEADKGCDDNGLSLAEARVIRARLPAPRDVSPERFHGFLELHIEQGGALDLAGEQIGVVEAIVGIRTERMRFCGQQNHAGTTLMHLRRDAFQGLVTMASRINERLAGVATPATVWTIGRVDLQPNANSVVPGRADFTIQWRDAEESRLDQMRDILYSTCEEVAGEMGLSWERFGCDSLPPTLSDPGLVGALSQAAGQLAAGKWRVMTSGALHDAANLSLRMPMAMLFVPSIAGISHSFAEDTAREDLELGLRVAAGAVCSYCRSRV